MKRRNLIIAALAIATLVVGSVFAFVPTSVKVKIDTTDATATISVGTFDASTTSTGTYTNPFLVNILDERTNQIVQRRGYANNGTTPLFSTSATPVTTTATIPD